MQQRLKGWSSHDFSSLSIICTSASLSGTGATTSSNPINKQYPTNINSPLPYLHPILPQSFPKPLLFIPPRLALHECNPHAVHESTTPSIINNLSEMNSKSLEEFDRLHANFKLREKELPEGVRWKLLFIASKIHQRPLRGSEMSCLRGEDIEELRNLDAGSLAVIFNTLVRTLLLEKKSGEKECEIKYPGFFEMWKGGRVRVEGSRLAVTCKKDTRHYDLSQLILGNNRKSKRSFDLQFKNQQLLTLKFASSELHQEVAALLQQEIDRYRPHSALENTSPLRNNNNQFFNLREVSLQEDFHQLSPVLVEDTLEKVEVPMKVEKMQRSREGSSEAEEAMVGEKPDGYRIIEESPQMLLCVKDSEARLQATLLVKTSCQLDKVVSYYLQQKEWNTAIASESIHELEVNSWQILRVFKSDSIFEKARGTLTHLKVNCSKNRASITEKSVEDGKSRDQTMCLLESTTKFTRCLGVVKITFECLFNGRGYYQIKDSSYMVVKLFQDMKFFENSLKINQLQKGKSKIVIQLASREELQKRSESHIYAETKIELGRLKMEPEDDQVSLKLEQQSAQMPKTDDSLELPLGKCTKTQAMLKLRPINPLNGPSLDYISLVLAQENERYYLTQRFDQKILTKYDNYIPDYALSEMLKRGGEYRITENKELLFIDEELLQNQKNTLKFIIRQIGASILSGKSVLNVSMPVDIFESRSLLERCAASFGLLPEYLLSAADASPLQQMKNVVAFIATLPTLEMLMQKPFNPILGQTFQAYLRGIPIYYEQISHHPPISAYYMTCPEFTLHGNLIAFANVSVNSAVGGNEGIMHIRMRNGTHFQCYFPPAQISGLIFGERKFRGYGRGYVFEETNSLFAEFSIEKAKKGLYQRGDQDSTPADVLGGIFKVTPQFAAEIGKKNTLRKYDGLTKKDIVEKLTVIKGIWFSDIMMDGEVINKGVKIHPVEYQRAVLPSDSNFRPDIMYHRLGDLDESQRMKEDLEIKQRADRKLREKCAKALKKRA